MLSRNIFWFFQTFSSQFPFNPTWMHIYIIDFVGNRPRTKFLGRWEDLLRHIHIHPNYGCVYKYNWGKCILWNNSNQIFKRLNSVALLAARRSTPTQPSAKSDIHPEAHHLILTNLVAHWSAHLLDRREIALQVHSIWLIRPISVGRVNMHQLKAYYFITKKKQL